MIRPLHRPALGLVLLAWTAIVPSAFAASTSPTDVSGIWRLDDRASDTPTSIEALLQRESMSERAPQVPQAPGKTGAAGAGGGFGHGGGHRGGIGGMGHGMGGGRHDAHRGEGKPAADDAPAKPTHFDTPPWLKDDSVLIVAEDDRTLQLRLDSGTQLDLRFDGPLQQALNGSAQVRCHRLIDGVHVEMTFADGSVLTQDWSLSADGQQLTLHQQWRVPALDRPVGFVRVYHKLG